ncbi:hypothetical protein C5167_050401 [Papaver somniferum]|uniref:Uncharacterized protein n=1 Tax=Papaver somniferum TaxID=3469 RepID=A0A4Y7KNK6_PAPSO|nr:hypothetical protein C5167_050401 [Papaver somniferum]
MQLWTSLRVSTGKCARNSGSQFLHELWTGYFTYEN